MTNYKYYIEITKEAMRGAGPLTLDEVMENIINSQTKGGKKRRDIPTKGILKNIIRRPGFKKVGHVNKEVFYGGTARFSQWIYEDENE